MDTQDTLDMRQKVTSAIEDVFVRTLRVDLAEDVPQLTGLVMGLIADAWDEGAAAGIPDGMAASWGRDPEAVNPYREGEE